MNEKIILYDFQHNAFTLFIILSYVLFFVSLIGLWKNAPKYIQHLDGYVKVYICLFLIYRFNPFRSKISFTELDRKIVFSAALFLLTTTAVSNIALKYFSDFKTNIAASTSNLKLDPVF
jgi:hypothetical protein